MIDITKNAQVDFGEFNYEHCLGFRSYKTQIPVEKTAIQEAAFLINMAKRPYVLFGQGVVLGTAEEELKLFLEKSGIPAASTLLGSGALSQDHPNYVGKLGMHGNYAPNVLTNSCDVLIAIGMRFDDRVTGNLATYAKQAKVIHFEIDPAEVDKNVKTDVAVLGTVKESLVEIMQYVNKGEHNEWMHEFSKLLDIENKTVINDQLNPTKEGLTMGEVMAGINRYTNGEAIIVSDVGQHQMFAWRYSKFVKTRSNVTSGGLGTMGFALPAAIGAKLGAEGREVIAIIGDGGYQMTCNELGTILQTKAAVKIVVLNNGYLGMVRQWQELFFDKRYASTEMISPDFVKLAKAYDIEATRVSKRENLEEAIKTMIQSKEAFFLEVVIEKEDNVFPMIPSGASVSDIRLS